jgi:hypothetical protein
MLVGNGEVAPPIELRCGTRGQRASVLNALAANHRLADGDRLDHEEERLLGVVVHVGRSRHHRRLVITLFCC